MKKLLMMGSFGDPGAMELQYEAGLQKIGWDVHRFEIAENFGARIKKSLLTKVINRVDPNLLTGKINLDAITATKNLQPDAVLIFKGMALHPDSLTEIRKHTHLLVNYNPDHPLRIYSAGGTNQNVIKGVPRYDVFISYAKAITQKIKALNGPAAYTIPFGYINSMQYDPVTLSGDAATPGFAFVGSWDREREEIFGQLNRNDVAIYGGNAWLKAKADSLVHQLYQKKGLYEKELIQCFQRATGVLNFMRPQNMDEASHNMRTFEVPGVGGLLLSPFTQEQADYFEPDKEAIFFTNLNELREKMDFLSKHPQECASIKQAARRRSISSRYSYDDRAAELADIIEHTLKK